MSGCQAFHSAVLIYIVLFHALFLSFPPCTLQMYVIQSGSRVLLVVSNSSCYRCAFLRAVEGAMIPADDEMSVPLVAFFFFFFSLSDAGVPR